MYPTVEVRWFYEGDVPEATLQRFRSGELPQDKGTVEERSDVYLFLRGVDGMGIKLRGTSTRREIVGDQLEIKRRQYEGNIVTFMPGVTGRLERWMKWVFHGESSDPLHSTIVTAEDQAWVSVGKVRYLRRYTVMGDKSVVAVPLSEWPDNRCNVELTRAIAPGGQVWWTLGLEAFGESEDNVEDILRFSASYFFAETGLGVFEERHSYGYPRWLNVVMTS
jgi:hypothetical protein